MYRLSVSKSIILSLALLSYNGTKAQSNKNNVLMTVGNSKITVEDFLNVYHKNNSTENLKDTKSLDEYVNLFVNFKLKVKEAEELGLDTVKSFKDELSGYRKQLAQPYLTDKAVNEKLLQETYTRLQTDIRASHILVKCNENALPKDTLEAYNKIMKIRTRILKGENFNNVASEKGISDDPSAKDNGGNLGYFTALQMVYPFETAAYNTKIGNISMPIRTRFGYHIVKVTDSRKARGEVLTAHIMVKTPVNMSKDDSLTAKTKITEIYNKLKAGEKFEDMATQFSDDKASAKKGGELPWFGTNKMPAEFEETSFLLQNKGDFSLPVKTQYGWHIIKLIDKKALASFNEMKNELKAKVTKDSRSQVGKESLIAKLKLEYSCKEIQKTREDFYKVVDTTLFDGRWDIAKAGSLSKTMFNFNDKIYTQKDFANYINSHQSKRSKADIKMVVDNLYKQFVDESIIAYEESRLDIKYPEFKALIQEYRDGILLFELTDKKVWSKAIKDTIGSKEYYENNKNNYMWNERADASIYSCADEKIAKKVHDLLKIGKAEKEIISEVNKISQLNLQVETRTFNKGENDMIDKNWTPGISEIIVSPTSKENIVISVNKLLKPEPKSYIDSKGVVTADYQNYLEKKWLEELKLKYKVTIDKDVLATIK